jgi:hypothetical protein
MLKERRAAAAAVKATFLPAEQAQDIAAIRAARCLAAALEARADARLPLATGLEAIAHLARGAALAVEARQSLIEAHRMLAAVPGEIGLPPHALGDVGDCPPVDPPKGEDLPAIRAVA